MIKLIKLLYSHQQNLMMIMIRKYKIFPFVVLPLLESDVESKTYDDLLKLRSKSKYWVKSGVRIRYPKWSKIICGLLFL